MGGSARRFIHGRVREPVNPRASAFDVLQADWEELLAQPYERRRAALEALFADCGLVAPWTLCPMTTDPAVAQDWLTAWTDVLGVEDLMIKGLEQRYLPGARGWFKVRRRHTTEAIVGAITGSISRPRILVLGRYGEHGTLRPVGRTVPLSPEAARQVAEHLHPAASGHPWTACGSPRPGAHAPPGGGPHRARRGGGGGRGHGH